jgi:hypothetical protein
MTSVVIAAVFDRDDFSHCRAHDRRTEDWRPIALGSRSAEERLLVTSTGFLVEHFPLSKGRIDAL